MESPNTGSLTKSLRVLGQTDEQMMRAFRGFNAWSWQFRRASEECEHK
jgi:hypothetical protein